MVEVEDRRCEMWLFLPWYCVYLTFPGEKWWVSMSKQNVFSHYANESYLILNDPICKFIMDCIE